MLDILGSGRGATRANDAQGTPTQSHISPSIQAYEESATDPARNCYKLTFQTADLFASSGDPDLIPASIPEEYDFGVS